MSELTILSEAEQDAVKYIDPKESFEAEAIKKAQMELAKELRDYEAMNEAFLAWVYQRFRTTELIQPNIEQGGYRHGEQSQGNDIVTLTDYGFTKMQWHRRTQELQAKETIDAYVAGCVENQQQPTLYGLIKFATPPREQEKVDIPRMWGHLPKEQVVLILIMDSILNVYNSVEDGKEFLSNLAVLMTDTIGQAALGVVPEYTEPWAFARPALDGYNSSFETDLRVAVTHSAFDTLGKEDPVISMESLFYVTEHALDIYLKKCKNRCTP